MKNRVSSIEADVVNIKDTFSTVRNCVLGASVICSAAVGVFLTFGWPVIQLACKRLQIPWGRQQDKPAQIRSGQQSTSCPPPSRK